jgi:hypothetical protein
MKILGSLDMFGNPISLIESVESGIKLKKFINFQTKSFIYKLYINYHFNYTFVM